MIHAGREIDVLALWGQFVDLPQNIGEPLPTFLPLVRCPNPVHTTTKKHFQINAKKPLVHCFAGCGISGTYEHAIAMIQGLKDDKGNLNERAARKVVLRASRLSLSGETEAPHRAGLRKVADEHSQLDADQRALDGGNFTWLPRTARTYLDTRGVDSSSRGKWQIGWDEDAERLVIPALDDRGEFAFLIRHRIDGVSRMKYEYTPGSIKTSLLFGACYLDREQLESFGLVLCEGPLDAIRLHQLGISNAVAILGTGISKAQMRLIDKLSPKRLYLMFDRDPSGVSNIEAVMFVKDDMNKMVASPLARRRRIFVCLYPGTKGDPAEMTRKEVERSIERAIPIAQFFRKARSVTLKRKVKAVG